MDRHQVPPDSSPAVRQHANAEPSSGALGALRRKLALAAAVVALLSLATMGRMGRTLWLLAVQALPSPFLVGVIEDVLAWGDPLPVNLLWPLTIAIAAQYLRRGRRWAGWLCMVMATTDVVQVLTLRPHANLLDGYFGLRVPFLLGEASLLALAACADTGAHWFRNWWKPESDVRARAFVVVGGSVWAAALWVWSWLLSEGQDGSVWPPLPFLSLVLRVATADRLHQMDRRLIRLAGWLSVICLFVTMGTPIAYGFVGLYLVLSWQGTTVLAMLVLATAALWLASTELARIASKRPGEQ